MLTVKYVQHIENYPKESVFAVRSVVRLWDQGPPVPCPPDETPKAKGLRDGILCILPDFEEYEIHSTPDSRNKVYVMNDHGTTVATYHI